MTDTEKRLVEIESLVCEEPCECSDCAAIRFLLATVQGLQKKVKAHRKRVNDTWVGIGRLQAENTRLRRALGKGRREAWEWARRLCADSATVFGSFDGIEGKTTAIEGYVAACEQLASIFGDESALEARERPEFWEDDPRFGKALAGPEGGEG